MIPMLPLPDEVSSPDEYLRNISFSGAKNRYGEISDEIRQRLDYELKVIGRLGWSGYFILLHDIVAAAKRMKIMTGPGRGSAGGSIVAYCAGITGVDPIRFNLLFEKFLNCDKISFPVVDIDIETQDRDILINYITRRYGRDRFAHIVTFRDLKIIDIIKDAIKRVKQNKGIVIQTEALLLDDEKTFHLFQRGDTNDVFQFESERMQDYLRELKPASIEHLIALNALYRPGSVDQIPIYIERKNSGQHIKYSHSMVKDILGYTFGIVVYQEQIMLLAQKLAGFSKEDSNAFRSYLGKKDTAKIKIVEEKFLNNVIADGMSESDANLILQQISKDDGYGFNRSHAAAYTLLSYQSAWLKANYPEEYTASVEKYK